MRPLPHPPDAGADLPGQIERYEPNKDMHIGRSLAGRSGALTVVTVRRVILAIGVPAVALAVAGGLWLSGGRAATTGDTVPPPAPLATTTVELATLSNTETFRGTLSYGPTYTVKGVGTGLLTKIAPVGTLTRRGQAVFRQNDLPVPVFYGASPMFRALGTRGDTGSDVDVVASNLGRLGFLANPGTRRNGHHVWNRAFTIAVRHWQRSIQLPVTGTIPLGQVLVLPAPSRVSGTIAQLGDPIAGPLLTLTGRVKSVAMSLQLDEAGKFKVGRAVTVTRPDGRDIKAKIESIGTQAVAAASPADATTNDPPTVSVQVSLKSQKAVRDLSYAPVQVSVATKTAANVLTAPTASLLALKEGGYALQLPSGELLPVETGMFSGDLVEVSGHGITAGLVIVTVSQ